MFKISISFISIFLCLNMGKAQTPPTAAPVATPSPTTESAPAPLDPLKIVTSIKTSSGKYDEYQSICRENIYDTVAFLSEDLQDKRIDLLNERIKSSKTSTSKLKVLLLKEYIDQSRFSEAEKYYAKLKEEKLSENDGKTVDALFAFIQNNLKQAESLLAKVVLDDPKNKEALTFLAEIYALDKNYFESLAAYFDLAKLTKENYDLNLCEILTLDSQYNEAEKSCQKAIRKHEDNPYPFIYLGISHREKLNYNEAIKYFKDSLRKKQTEMGFTCLGEIYFIKENFYGASALFKRASKIFPNSARALLGLAWSQFKDKKLSDSLETFKLACSKDRKVKVEIRRAFKILSEENSNAAKQFAELAQNCTD